tara:strand:+ start:982 stop:1569 length:588 start_codon:yes stop_codon:yes gene_type:complete
MASTFDYTFNRLTRVGNDNCGISQRNLQNSNSATYLLNNYRPACPMKSAMEFATSQPNVNFNGSHQVGINGCNIDNNSELSITKITKPKCRISLNQRLFATVPFLGRGKSNPLLESRLMQGDLANNRKSANPSSEISHIDYRHTPMISSLKDSVTNPANICESEAAEGWIRGGLPSRDLTRDKEYAASQAKKHYV